MKHAVNIISFYYNFFLYVYESNHCSIFVCLQEFYDQYSLYPVAELYYTATVPTELKAVSWPMNAK